MEGIIQILGKRGNTDALARFIKTFEETYGLKQKSGKRDRAAKSPLRVHLTEAKRPSSKLQSPSAMDISCPAGTYHPLSPQAMSPYHHLEGNIEVSNPFYSDLMLERKSIDGFESLGTTSSVAKTILTKKPEKLAPQSTNPFHVS